MAGVSMAALTVLNLLAYQHARAMTHFCSGGERTPRPEALSLAQKAGVLMTGVTLPRPENQRTPAELGLAYQQHVFKSADGTRLEAWLVPQDDSRGVVILFHGYADKKDSLLAAAKVFHELGYTTLLVDFRGCGGSGGSETSIGYHEAEDVVAALAWARQRMVQRRHVLFGASMGAAAVLRAVGDLGARPGALVLQYPFDTLTHSVRHRFEALHVPVFPAAELLVFWGGWQHGFNGFRYNPADYARQVRCPTLLMVGDRDERVTLDDSRRIFDALAGPKQMRIFTGLGHESLLQPRPQEWRETVASFLGGLGQS